MDSIANMPVIGDIITAFLAYTTSSIAIAKHPFTFPAVRDLPNVRIGHALSYVFAAAVVSYFLFIPAYIRWHDDLLRPLVVINYLLYILLTSLIAHFVFVIFNGSKMPLKVTAVLNCYFYGFLE